MEFMNEVWRDVPGYEGTYQVSNIGRVKSLSRVIVREYKSRPLHGSLNPASKLSEQQVSDIRRLAAEGRLSQSFIAKRFGVCQALISNIKNGKIRKS